MKKRLLVTLFSIVIAILAADVAVAQQPSQSGPTRKEIITQQRQAELASKYGLTQAQIDQFEELLRQCNVKYAEINSLQLPPKERGQRIGEAKRTFRAQVADVMPPEQYQRWLADQQQQDETLTRLRNERLTRLKQIEASDAPEGQKVEERKAVEAGYQAAVKSAVGEAKGATVIDQQRAAGEWHKNNNKGLTLTRSEAHKLASLNKGRDKQLATIEESNLSRPEERAARESIKNNHNAEVKNALGNQKYSIWARNRANSMDRDLAKKYGMTPDQIRGYKSLLNEQQVAKMKLRESTLPPNEKLAKHREIEKQFSDGLNQILSPQQSSKVIRDESYRRYMQQQKRDQRGPRPAPPTN